MIETFATTQAAQPQTQRVLTYVKNERMGGYVPKYEIVKASEANVSQNIEDSLVGAQGLDTLAYQPTPTNINEAEQFGFSDLIDMVNPLHHIPVVGHVYREITGDEIKPIGKILGGAAFGGPLGVATALIDTVVTEETGKDMAGNALDMAFNRQDNEPQTTQIAQLDAPETAIENALDASKDYEMTTALLTYSNLGAKDEAMLKYEAYQRVENAMEAPIEREDITRVSFSDKGGLYAL